ncbi:MAG: transposase [Desulfovibrionaceae bacterium]|jgi:putative transposase|nr:transposase [Desulfovibrionaceae bacterium]
MLWQPVSAILLRREGWTVNQKRVERIYRAEGLVAAAQAPTQAHEPPARGCARTDRAEPAVAMDFMGDSLENGRRFRGRTIVDLWDRSLTGERVARVLERLRAMGKCPGVIRTDNSPEFTDKALDRWAQATGVKLKFIRPGKPMANRPHGELRRQAPRGVPGRPDVLHPGRDSTVIETWRRDYHTESSHSSLGGLSPEEYRKTCRWKNQSSQSTNFWLAYSAG